MLTKQERENRIIARGEISGHSHIVTGDVMITRSDNEVIIEVGEDSNACLKHLLEKPYLEEGLEISTHEHKDIPLSPGKYKYIPQMEYDPYKDIIEKLKD